MQTEPTSQRTWTDAAFVLAGLAAVVFGIVGVTWAQQGFVAAMRGGVAMVQPVGFVWLACLAAALHGYAKWRRSDGSLRVVAFWTAAFLAWSIVGNGGFSNWLSGRMEMPPQTLPHSALERRDLEEPLDAVVVLGGGSSVVLPGFSELNRAGERVVSAAQAFHAGATRAIIVTGTSTDGTDSPSEQSTQLLVSLGVPADVIFPINGVDTEQEMASLKEFLASPPVGFPQRPEAIGLITSSYHMSRAMRLAERQSLSLMPLPCEFRSSRNDQPFVASQLIPGAGSLDAVALMTKELIARLAGE